MNTQATSLTTRHGGELSALAEAINREHALVLQAGQAMVEHAITAGEALLEARELTATGDWFAWLDANFSGKRTAAHNYMRLAIHKDAVRGALSIRKALTSIAGEPGLVPGGRPVYPEELREEVRIAHSEGASLNSLSHDYQISTDTIRKWVDSDYYELRKRQQSEQRKLRRAAENVARKRKERARLKRVAREKDGGIAEVYSLTCRLEDELGRARGEATKPAAKAALQSATEHFHKMRDEVVRALGVS